MNFTPRSVSDHSSERRQVTNFKCIEQRSLCCPSWDFRGMKQETVRRSAPHLRESQQVYFVPWTSDSRKGAILGIRIGQFKKQNS